MTQRSDRFLRRILIGLLIAILTIAVVPYGINLYRHSGLQPGQCYEIETATTGQIIVQVDQVTEYGVVLHAVLYRNHPIIGGNVYILMPAFKESFQHCDCSPLK